MNGKTSKSGVIWLAAGVIALAAVALIPASRRCAPGGFPRWAVGRGLG